MATKCETYQANIKNYDIAVTNTTADFNSKKEAAASRLNGFVKDHGQYNCGNSVAAPGIQIDAFLNGGSLIASNCKSKLPFQPCSKDTCVSSANGTNEAILAMQNAYNVKNESINKLAAEKLNFGKDPDCAQQVKDVTEQANIDAENNRKVKNNIKIAAVIVLLIILIVWAYRKFVKKGK